MSGHVILLFISLSSILAVNLDDHQYCAIRYKRLCQEKGKHVACEYPTDGPGPSCENYTSIKFTDDLKYFITHYINRRRQRIAAGTERVRGGLHLPKPELMMLAIWDRELAFLAQRLADQCCFVHDDCRATVRYPYPGQTVGEVRWRRSSDSDELSAQRAIRRVFDAWWGERRRVTPKHLTEPFRLNSKGGGYGHFTQLAVWTLHAVGCAAVRHGGNYTRLLVVCDFSHTNMLGQRTLVPGPMKACPYHTVRRPRSLYPLLCGPVRHPRERNNEDISGIHEYDDQVDGTMELNQVSTTSVLVQASRDNSDQSVDEKEYFKFRNDEFKLRAENIKKLSRNDVIMEKIEIMKEADDDKERAMSGLRQFSTRRPLHGQLQLAHTQDQVSRPRWKQTRERPRRPGANALLNIATVTEKNIVKIQKSSIVSFKLDKEDIDQLFRDTGFSISLKKDK